MDKDTLDRLIYYTIRFDEKSITRLMNEIYQTETFEFFIFDFMSLVLNNLGRKWESGEILPIHEHFLSEIITAFIIQKKFEIKKIIREEDLKPNILLATITPETHSLGIRLVDLVLSKNKAKTLFIGDRTPVDDIIYVCNNSQIDIVALSFPVSTVSKTVEATLFYLRQHISEDIYLWYGGESSREVHTSLANCSYINLNDIERELIKINSKE